MPNVRFAYSFYNNDFFLKSYPLPPLRLGIEPRAWSKSGAPTVTALMKQVSRPLSGGCCLLCRVSRSVRPCLLFPGFPAMLGLPSISMRYRMRVSTEAGVCTARRRGFQISNVSGATLCPHGPKSGGWRHAGKERRGRKDIEEKARCHAVKKSCGGS